MHLKKLMLSLFLSVNILTLFSNNCFASTKVPSTPPSIIPLDIPIPYSQDYENFTVPYYSYDTESSFDSINNLNWDSQITLKLLNGTTIEESYIYGDNPSMPKNRLIEILHTDPIYEAYSFFPLSNCIDFKFSTFNYICFFRINFNSKTIFYSFENNTGFKTNQNFSYNINYNILNLTNTYDKCNILYTFCPTNVFKTVKDPGHKNDISPHTIPDIVARKLFFILNNNVNELADKLINYYVGPNENDF